jgi:hypothetical protein
MPFQDAADIILARRCISKDDAIRWLMDEIDKGVVVPRDFVENEEEWRKALDRRGWSLAWAASQFVVRDSEIDVESLIGTNEAPRNPGGRPRKYDWECALAAVFGKIYRGEVLEDNIRTQADIQRLLTDWFAGQGKELDEGTNSMKKYARMIWQEIKR